MRQEHDGTDEHPCRAAELTAVPGPQVPLEATGTRQRYFKLHRFLLGSFCLAHFSITIVRVDSLQAERPENHGGSLPAPPGEGSLVKGRNPGRTVGIYEPPG